MKIASKRLDLAEIGYEGYYVMAPKSVREGWFNDLATLTRATNGAADPEKNRDANLRVFELVTEWNLDDEEGNPLPLVRDVTDPEEKKSVIAEIPLDVILHVVKKTLGGSEVPEKTRDF